MLDINLLRSEEGRKIVLESEKRRFQKNENLEEIIKVDLEWRKERHNLDMASQLKNRLSNTVKERVKEAKKNKQNIGQLMKGGDDFTGNASDVAAKYSEVKADPEKLKELLDGFTVKQLGQISKALQKTVAELKETVEHLEEERVSLWKKVGNLVHDDCPRFLKEKDNRIERTVGELKTKDQAPFNHVDLMMALDGIDVQQGGKVAGSRGYFLKGDLVLLNMALIQYGLAFLTSRKYTPIQPPFMMTHETMRHVAQLDQFTEELYNIAEKKREYLTEGDIKNSNHSKKAKHDMKQELNQQKYLIATSEQPICALNMGKTFTKKDLPIRYVGYSTCFRKEAGSHGRDTLGIFRVHQFEKIEQFCLTSPDDGESWKMHQEMFSQSEEFYKSLGLSFQVVNIVSGKLNNAAAMKLDLEAWFPASQTFRELVSCSNCTDYQSRPLNIRYKETTDSKGKFVHMLNSTLTATSRTMCCIVENYQTEEGIIIPEVLRPFMGGRKILKFKKKPVVYVPPDAKHHQSSQEAKRKKKQQKKK